jgi:hypothetical protein
MTRTYDVDVHNLLSLYSRLYGIEYTVFPVPKRHTFTDTILYVPSDDLSVHFTPPRRSLKGFLEFVSNSNKFIEM